MRGNLVGCRIDADDLALGGAVDKQFAVFAGNGVLELPANVNCGNCGVRLRVDDSNGPGVAVHDEDVVADRVERDGVRAFGGLDVFLDSEGLQIEGRRLAGFPFIRISPIACGDHGYAMGDSREALHMADDISARAVNDSQLVSVCDEHTTRS